MCFIVYDLINSRPEEEEMTRDEVNRTIHEARGLCWHDIGEWKLFDDFPILCKKCGQQWCSFPLSNNNEWPNTDYHTPEGFFSCWNWAKEKEWFQQFLCWCHFKAKWESFWEYNETWAVPVDLVNYRTFAPILAEFLKERKK
jgi:hypothetical protein